MPRVCTVEGCEKPHCARGYCVERGCLRKGHPDPEHGHPVCRKHAIPRNDALKDHIG